MSTTTPEGKFYKEANDNKTGIPEKQIAFLERYQDKIISFFQDHNNTWYDLSDLDALGYFPNIDKSTDEYAELESFARSLLDGLTNQSILERIVYVPPKEQNLSELIASSRWKMNIFNNNNRSVKYKYIIQGDI